MGMFSKNKKESTSDLEKQVKEPKVKTTKSTLKVKNDPSKMASFWVVDTKTTPETMLFSGTISECRDYLYLASKKLMI